MTMRRAFLSRLFREKLLIAIFLVIAAAMWLSSFSGRAGQFARRWGSTGTELRSQQLVLSDASGIEQRAADAVAHFDPAKTLDSTRLIGVLGVMAQQAGLANTTAGDARTERTSQFAVHSVQFTVRRAELQPLLGFYEALLGRAPYVGLEECTITADPANPALLTASLRVTAVEVVR